MPGLGAFARVEGKEVGLVRPEAWDLPPEVEAQVKALAEEGFSLSLLVREGVPLALLAFQDTPRLEAREVLAELRRLGLKPLLLTGDRETSALALGTAIGLFPEEIRAGLSPVDKLRLVEELAGRGGVAMVGDGVNDAPALAQADVGIAMGTGTAVAIAASDITLISGNLAGVPAAIELSRAAMANIRAILAGLTRGMPLELFDRGFIRQDGIDVNFFPQTGSLGVLLPSNSPGVNSLWLPALVMKIPVVLKPGREDPLTPFRIVQAMIAAGFPREAFGFYPAGHDGGDAVPVAIPLTLRVTAAASRPAPSRSSAPSAAWAAWPSTRPRRSCAASPPPSP